MSRKTVFLVLHGEKQDVMSGDPGHSSTGMDQVESLRQFLPPGKPPALAAGIGRRHQQMIALLGFVLSDVTHWCPDLGGPQSLESDNVHVRLTGGIQIPYKTLIYSPLVGRAIIALLESLPEGTICCTGRPIARSLDMDHPEDFPSASVWRFVIEDGRIVEHTILGKASDDVGGKDKEV